MCINFCTEIHQALRAKELIDLLLLIFRMVLSKSFGYALRGVLYVSLMSDERRKIRIEEIAAALGVPRHFLGKIMKQVVKAGIISSTRGQQGGFYINEQTLQTPLEKIILLTEGEAYFTTCMLSMRPCNAADPCPLHNRLYGFKTEVREFYRQTTVADLLQTDKPQFIHSLSIHQAV
jgi:Rrf2 family protein